MGTVYDQEEKGIVGSQTRCSLTVHMGFCTTVGSQLLVTLSKKGPDRPLGGPWLGFLFLSPFSVLQL